MSRLIGRLMPQVVMLTQYVILRLTHRVPNVQLNLIIADLNGLAIMTLSDYIVERNKILKFL